MDFKSACINGVSFGDIKDMSEEELLTLKGNKYIENVNFMDKNFAKIIETPSPIFTKHRNFLKALTLCHSAVPYTDNNNVFRF